MSLRLHQVNMADYISKCRLGLMALAIVLVVVYHYKCWVGGFPWYIGMILQWGFIGVDIFFLLSGFGLTYSFRKNSIGGFYKNRLIKILPCYLLMGSILVLDRLAGGYEMSGGEILWMFSTLDYTFNHGGVDWYVSAILQLYLLFPLFYYIIVRTRMGGNSHSSNSFGCNMAMPYALVSACNAASYSNVCVWNLSGNVS